MASNKSFSKIYRLISDGPLPASPVNSGEPLWIIAIREPCGFIFLMAFSKNSICPSAVDGKPGPNRPSKPNLASFLTITSSFFHSRPNGGLEII